MLNLISMILIAYLVGSIPTAIIYGKIFRGIDIREHGSGNAGATNVFRVMGWKSGLIVLLVDITKGLIATLFIYKIAINSVPFEPVLIQIIAGFSAVFGHIWTIFAGFKGGKGVGTGAGMIIGIAPESVLAGLIIFIITVGLTRFVSLGSVLASITIPFYLFFKKTFFQGNVSKILMIFSLFIPILIIYTHRSNIIRLFNGTENKIKLS